MAIAVVSNLSTSGDGVSFRLDYYIEPYVNSAEGSTQNFTFTDLTDINVTTIKAGVEAFVIAHAFDTWALTITGANVLWLTGAFMQPTEFAAFKAATQSRVVTDGVSHSFVTTAAAANGFQISSTRDALVNYSVTVSSAVQIGLITNVTGYCVLEVAATNSTTAGDWKEKGRVGTGQNVGLALAFSSTQTATAPLFAMVPAGYYARLRTVNSNGTPTYTYISGTEVLV